MTWWAADTLALAFAGLAAAAASPTMRARLTARSDHVCFIDNGPTRLRLTCPFCAKNGSHGFPDFLFCEPRIGTGALSSFSSLRLLQLSGASRDLGHLVWSPALPSSPPIPRVWSRGCARHIPGRRPVRHAAGPCRDMGARFRTPSHAHQPTSR